MFCVASFKTYTKHTGEILSKNFQEILNMKKILKNFIRTIHNKLYSANDDAAKTSWKTLFD